MKVEENSKSFWYSTVGRGVIMESDEDIIDDLTVAMHLDSIKYDPNTLNYEIQLSSVQLVHLDTENDIIRLKIPSHRLQRMRTALHNAEPTSTSSPFPVNAPLNSETAKRTYQRRVSNGVASPRSDISHKSGDEMDEMQYDVEKESPDPNLDDITNGNYSEPSDEATLNEDRLREEDDEKRSLEKLPETPNDSPSQPDNAPPVVRPQDVKLLKRTRVVREWSDILRAVWREGVFHILLRNNNGQIGWCVWNIYSTEVTLQMVVKKL